VLIHFTAENYRSFGEEQTLNLLATSLKDHPEHGVAIPGTDKSALPIGIIYGANASGKSNLVQAMLFGQSLVLGGTSIKALAQDRFRFVKKGQPTSLEFRFLSQGQVLTYGFTATAESIQEEWLDVTAESGREVSVFARTGSEIAVGELRASGARDPASLRTLKALQELGVRPDQLLLSKIVDLPEKRRGEILSGLVAARGAHHHPAGGPVRSSDP
jgi:hypothetical protein